MELAGPQDRAALLRALEQLGQSAAPDPSEGALLLASLERPRVPLERYRHHLMLLARDVVGRLGEADQDDVKGRANALNDVILGDYGYDGDRLTYDDPQNANLMRVIDRRRGLPVALSLLYLHCCRAAGWRGEALAFPGHVLFRLEEAGERLILDPFNGGRFLGPAELRVLLKRVAGPSAELSPESTRAMTERELLLRLQNNLKTRRWHDGDLAGAARILETMQLLAPQQAGFWLELAEVQQAQGELRAALRALDRYLALENDAQRRHHAAHLMQELRAQLM